MHRILKFIDSFLDHTTMYRLVLYVLTAFLAAALVLSAVGMMPFSPLGLLVSAVIITAISWISDSILARIFKAHTNVESVYITAFILALIISPPVLDMGGTSNSFGTFGAYLALAIMASFLAVASKYLLALHRKHIFNPAAIAVVITALAFNQSASWWVGTAWMMPFVLIGGALIVRKIRRADLVLSFLIVAFVSILGNTILRGFSAGIDLDGSLSVLPNLFMRVLLDTPILFFSFIMLTEPMTTPPSRRLRIWYGIIVGALFAPWVHIDLPFFGALYSTPELALVAGNIFSYAVSPKRKLLLTLKEKVRQTPDVYDFVFTTEASRNSSLVRFKPGQYLEWTLAQNKPDNRGNRRYFTVASSPSELAAKNEIRMGVKFYPEPSTFKRQLTAMKPGDQIIAGQLAGDFVLPKDPARKLVFLAGGIGVTPFRSMIKQILDSENSENDTSSGAARNSAHRDITLIYSARTSADLAYKELFDEASRRLGINVVYVVGPAPTIETITKAVPDYKERIFYISGPYFMVTAFQHLLKTAGVPISHVKTDFFPGFA